MRKMFPTIPLLLLFAICGTAHAADRIVSLVPSVTETLFALGVGNQVVGVSLYDDYPPEVTKLPRVGSFLTPNIEAIAALRPTLVIGRGISSNQREIRALKSMGYETMMVNDDSLAQIEDGIGQIGERLSRRDAAKVIVNGIETSVTEVREKLRGRPARRALMLVGHQPIVAVGPGTFLDDLLKIAAAENIADKSSQQWPKLSIEYIIAMRPEVILDGQMGSDPTSPSRFWSAYPSIPAVATHRVIGYPEDPTLHPGPRVGKTLEMLAKLIHPEAWSIDITRDGTR
jgi:iron complex transport system substrate-binding protein